MALHASDLEPAQQVRAVRRLYDTMKRHRELVVEIVRPTILAILAALLILVILPAALGAQADAIH
jgi:hypothetical protein